MPVDRRQLRTTLQKQKTLDALSREEGEQAPVSSAAIVQFGERKVQQGKLMYKIGIARKNETYFYSAKDCKTDEKLEIKEVALKLKEDRDAAKAEMKFRENHLLPHPCIVQYFDGKTMKKGDGGGAGGARGNRPSVYGKALYLLELCEGGPLSQLIERRNDAAENGSRCPCLNQEEVLEVLSGVSQGLAYLRRMEINHYNLTTENIVLGSDGMWKIGDFVFASSKEFKLSKESPKKLLNEARSFFGHLKIVPPEVVNLERLRWPIGPKVDIFSIGALLFASLTGEDPLSKLTSEEEHINSQANLQLPLEAHNAYPPAISKWVSRLSARDPRFRPTAEEFKSEVERFRALSEEPPDVPAEMLSEILSQLAEFKEQRRYKEVGEVIAPLEDIVKHFTDSKDNASVGELLAQKASLIEELKDQILDDYKTLNKPEYLWQPGIENALYCVDVLDDKFRTEVVAQFSEGLLQKYINVFEPPKPDSGLEFWDRRFSFLRPLLRDFDQKHARFFMARWCVTCGIHFMFCRMTREHLEEVLGGRRGPTPGAHTAPAAVSSSSGNVASVSPNTESNGSQSRIGSLFGALGGGSARSAPHELAGIDPGLLVAALRSTIEFENKIRKQYPPAGMYKDIDYVGMITKGFDEHMGNWVSREEGMLLDDMRKDMGPGIETIMSRIDPNLVFSSAEALLKRMLVTEGTAITLSTRKPLLEISEMLEAVLTTYLDKLCDKMPVPDKVTKPLSRDSVQEICCIIGTAQYLDERSTHLEKQIKDAIDVSLAEDVSFEDMQEVSRGVVYSASKVLAKSVLASLDEAFRHMTRTDWANITPPTGRRRSAFVDEMTRTLEVDFEPISKLLSKDHFQFFCDKFVQAFVVRFMEEIFNLRKVSQQGAQQLLEDTQDIKNDLLEVPVTCTGYQMRPMYSKYVIREMGKAENMLHALSTPDVDAAEIAELFGDGSSPQSAAQIERLLALRVDSPSTSIDDLKYNMQNLGFKVQDQMNDLHEKNMQTAANIQSNITNFTQAANQRLKEKKGQAAENLKTMHDNVRRKLMSFNIPGLS